MSRRIAIKLEDGQIITYQTYFQNDREIAAEIKRLFPFATGWQPETRTSNVGKRWMAAIIVLTLALMSFYFKDVIYTEIQMQVFRYQINRSIVDLLSQQARVTPTPTLIPGSKRSDIGVISSEQRDRLGHVEIVGEVQNFGHRAYDAIEVQIVFYDERGNEVAIKHGLVAPNVLEPGDRGRFAIAVESEEGIVWYHRAMVLE